jgi:hypothetical protein
MTEAKNKKPKWKVFGYAAVAAVALAWVVGVMDNLGKAYRPLSSVGRFVEAHGITAALRNETVRTHVGKDLLAKLHSDGIACFGLARAIDLDGDGVKSDLAVVFKRTETPNNCDEAADSPDDAAFFKLVWNGFRFVGDPDLPGAVTAWNFAGPAAFREAADSSYPTIDVYMLTDEHIVDAAQIDTVTAAEYTGTNYVETKDGKAAWGHHGSLDLKGQFQFRRQALDPQT